ncbi:MAG: hypothetical protein Ct9H90mP6_04390 [Gammaproteobacteria bacterium]|nr:MAG: hypothetical protein Ct9H90mP6_04390 [Gammaproteobacteria bacterium]
MGMGIKNYKDIREGDKIEVLIGKKNFSINLR